MIARKIEWLILEGILLGIFGHFGSSAAAAVALLLVLLPLIGIPMNLYLRNRMRVTVSAEHVFEKGGCCKFSVIFENPTVFPVMHVHGEVFLENLLNEEQSVVPVSCWVTPRKIQTVSLQAGSNFCGQISISVRQIVLYDFLGLIGIKCRDSAVGNITVQPDTFRMEAGISHISDSIEESDIYSQTKPGTDLKEIYQIREYVPGDSPKQIHWKLSNKYDRLLVREPAMPITRNVLVFWERTGQSGDRELTDAQAETVVSLCRNLLEQAVTFTVGWNDTKDNRCVLQEIHDMEEMAGILPRLLSAAGVRTGVSGACLLVQTGIPAMCAHTVYVAEEPQSEVSQMQQFGHVTMLLCGKEAVEDAVLFDRQNYREQLMQILI